MDDIQINEAIQHIVSALKDRGYDPYSQIYGYLKESNPAYITKHNGARELIQKLDKSKLKQYLETITY